MSSPNISFAGTGISGNTRKPGVYFYENVSNALSGLQPTADSICLIAQQLSTGSVASNTPTKVFTDADAGLYFGQGSVAHLMTRSAILANPNAQLTVVGVTDGVGSVKADGTVAIGALPAAGGTLTCWIGDVMAQASYTSSDTSASVATKLHTAYNTYSNLLPVTLADSSGKLTMVAKNGGTVGNMIPLSVADTNGSSYVTITKMAHGATDPDVGNYTDASTLGSIVGGGYTIYVNGIPQTQASHDAQTKIQSMVDFVSGPMEQRPAISVFAATDIVDTYANVKTLCGTTLNSGRSTCAYLDYASGSIAKSEYYKIAAGYAAVIASESDPTIPYNNLPITAIAPPTVIDRLTRTEQEDLLNSGVTPLQVIPGELVAIVRAISTYTVNSFSQPDVTLLDINTYRTLDFVRAQIVARLQARFTRGKINARIVKSVRTEIIAVLYLLQQLEIVQNVDTYKAGVLVEQDLSDPTRLDAQVPTNIVSGLSVIAGTIDLILS